MTTQGNDHDSKDDALSAILGDESPHYGTTAPAESLEDPHDDLSQDLETPLRV